MLEKFLKFIGYNKKDEILTKIAEPNEEIVPKNETEETNAEVLLSTTVKETKPKEEIVLEHKTEEIEEYNLPPLELLDTKKDSSSEVKAKGLAERASKLQKVLYSFKVMAKVENILVGPTIITYEIKLSEGVSISKVTRLKDDIALNLGIKIIDIKPALEERLVDIQMERKEKEIVKFGEIIKSEEFQKSASQLTIGLGKDIYGKIKLIDIKKTSHILISGTTGSGKSMLLNVFISSIVYKASPDEVKLLIVDTKGVDLTIYNGIPHLLIPVITDKEKATGALAWLYQEMNNRYKMFGNKKVKNIEEYNEITDNITRLPYIVLIIDELADLIAEQEDTEECIYRLSKNAKYAGIYLIIVTSRPSIDIVKGIIKAQIPTRIAFKLPEQIDSRVILDSVGAEKLFGNGDMLLKEFGTYEASRYQGAFISNDEIKRLTNYIKVEKFSEDILNEIEEEEEDPLLDEAIESVIATGQASTSFIQRKFRIDYARSGRIIDQMEERGIISGYQGSKPRDVLMSMDEWKKQVKRP